MEETSDDRRGPGNPAQPLGGVGFLIYHKRQEFRDHHYGYPLGYRRCWYPGGYCHPALQERLHSHQWGNQMQFELFYYSGSGQLSDHGGS